MRDDIINRQPIIEKKWDGAERPFYKQCRGCKHKYSLFLESRGRDNPWYWTCLRAPQHTIVLPDGTVEYEEFDPDRSEFCEIRNRNGNCQLFELRRRTVGQSIISAIRRTWSRLRR